VRWMRFMVLWELIGLVEGDRNSGIGCVMS
jgi:hypothetical protein